MTVHACHHTQHPPPAATTRQQASPAEPQVTLLVTPAHGGQRAREAAQSRCPGSLMDSSKPQPALSPPSPCGPRAQRRPLRPTPPPAMPLDAAMAPPGCGGPGKWRPRVPTPLGQAGWRQPRLRGPERAPCIFSAPLHPNRK